MSATTSSMPLRPMGAPAVTKASVIPPTVTPSHLREYLLGSQQIPGVTATPAPKAGGADGAGVGAAATAAGAAAAGAAAAGGNKILGLEPHWFALIVAGVLLMCFVGYKIYQFAQSKKKKPQDPAPAQPTGPGPPPASHAQQQQRPQAQKPPQSRDYMTAAQVRKLLEAQRAHQQPQQAQTQ